MTGKPASAFSIAELTSFWIPLKTFSHCFSFKFLHILLAIEANDKSSSSSSSLACLLASFMRLNISFVTWSRLLDAAVARNF